MTGLTVDNVYYNVAVTFDSMERSFELIEGTNGGTAITGRAIRDILGTSYSYSMNVEPRDGYESDYDDFYYAITAPVDFHNVVVPFGQNLFAFEAKITSGTDTYKGNYGGTEHWGGLKVNFEAMAPYRLAD